MKKKITALCLCVALLAVAVVGASLAYFTDTKSATNTFTVGNVKLELLESSLHRENAGIANHNVDLAVTLMQCGAEARDAVEVAEVERHQRGLSPGRIDVVVEFLKSADGAGDRDHMRAGLGERERGGVADATRGTGDEGNAGSERRCHGRNPGQETASLIRGLGGHRHGFRPDFSVL